MKKTIKLIAFAVSSLIITACGSSDITTEELMKAVKQNVQNTIPGSYLKVADVVLFKSGEDKSLYSGNVYLKHGSKIQQDSIKVNCTGSGDVQWQIGPRTGSFNFFDSVEGSVDLSEYRETAKTNMKLVNSAIANFLASNPYKSSKDVNQNDLWIYLDKDHNSKEKLRVGSYNIQIKNGKVSYPGLTN